MLKQSVMYKPSTLLGHSPSRMHTLRRRTAPHLALARNSLSSGVTTSTRNMATQQSLPPARSWSRWGWWSGMNKAADISSPVKKRCGPASRPAVKYPVLQIKTFSDHSSRGALSVSRLVRSVWMYDGSGGGHHSSNWGSIMCTRWGNLITSLPNLASTGRLLMAGHWPVTPPPPTTTDTTEMVTCKPKNHLWATSSFSQKDWHKHAF